MRERVFHLKKKSLKRVLGTGDLFAIGYGDVGSSIYYALDATALYALGGLPISLAIGGLLFICTAMTYAEMGSAFREPGGSATYTRHAFNDLISFVAGWGLLLDYIVTIAISAFSIPPYLFQLLRVFGVEEAASISAHVGLTIVIIGFLLLVNIAGVKHSTRISFFLAIVSIITQLVIIVLGAVLLLNLPFIFSNMRVISPGNAWSPDWSNFLKGTAMAMVAYTGIEAITQLTAETKNPGTVIPKAIRRTSFVLIILYLGIAFVGLSAVSPQDLGTKYLMDPLAGIVLQFPVGGEWLAPWVGLIAAVLLLVASNAGLIGSSRLIYSMGEYYQVPRMFYKLHTRFRTPYISLTVFAVLASCIILLSRGELLFLADMYNFGAMIAFFFAHLSLIILRLKKPDLNRPYRAPLNIPLGRRRSIPITAVLGVLGTFTTWCVVVITKQEGRNLGFIWLFLGVVMYLVYRRKKRIAAMGQLQIESVKIPKYETMQVKNILLLARPSEFESVQLACQMAARHKAELKVVCILEVPPTLPLEADERDAIGEQTLKQAEAIAREHHLTVELSLIRVRSLEEAVKDLIKSGSFDLFVAGISSDELSEIGSVGSRISHFLEDLPCRAWLCKKTSGKTPR